PAGTGDRASAAGNGPCAARHAGPGVLPGDHHRGRPRPAYRCRAAAAHPVRLAGTAAGDEDEARRRSRRGARRTAGRVALPPSHPVVAARLRPGTGSVRLADWAGAARHQPAALISGPSPSLTLRARTGNSIVLPPPAALPYTQGSFLNAART